MITLTRADSPKITARAARYFALRFANDEGCTYCTVRALLRECRELMTQVAEMPPLAEVDDFAHAVRDVLAHEPGPTTCQNCLKARRAAPRLSPHDHQAVAAACPIHALCAAHRGAS